MPLSLLTLPAVENARIAKPVQIDTLKSTIQQVLDSRTEQPGSDITAVE